MAAKKKSAKKTSAKKKPAKKSAKAAKKKSAAKKTSAKKKPAKKSTAKKTSAKKTSAKKKPTAKAKKPAKKASAKPAKKKAAKKKPTKRARRSVPPPSGGRRIPMPGTKAPDFTLEAADGGTVSLADHKGQFVVVYFYPKDDTPGCTREAQAFSDASRKLKKLNAVVYGISKDSIASHCKFRDKYGLKVGLLSDPDLEALLAYGAWSEKKRYGRTYMGIIRSTFVIGPDQHVIQAWPNVRVDGHIDDVLAVIAER